MKFRRLRNWTKPEECKPLIYFAQLIDEMLFTYTIDTYKPSVINTPIIGLECLETIDDVEEGIINDKNIEHLVAELLHNLLHDSVAEEILGEAYQTVCNKLKDKTISPKERRSIVEIILIQLSPIAYKEISEKQIKIEVDNPQWSTEKIRKLTRSYISLLIYIGFSQAAIKIKMEMTFFNEHSKIEKNNDVTKFFDELAFEHKKYQAYFIADPIFNEAEPAFKNLKILITTEPPEELKDHVFFKNIQRKLIITSKEISAFDHHSAREKSEEKIKLAASFLNLFHHKEKPSWSNESLIVEGEKVYKVSKRLNPMTKCKDMRPQKAKMMLESFMSDFDMSNDSFIKFMRSAQLHSMALKSESIENQLLNLWTSLESLVPNETRSKDEATIEHIADSIIPFLNISYLDGLIENLLRDLINWNRFIVNHHLKGIPGRHKAKLAKLLIMPEYEGARISLIGKFRDYSLLKDRFQHIQNIVSTPEEIKKTLDNHTKRLQWQFRRIYRTRNKIVHSGSSFPFTNLLIEHTHNYLDVIFDNMVYLGSNPQKIRTVTQGFRYIEMIYQSRYKLLTDSRTVLSANVIEQNILWRN